MKTRGKSTANFYERYGCSHRANDDDERRRPSPPPPLRALSSIASSPSSASLLEHERAPDNLDLIAPLHSSSFDALLEFLDHASNPLKRISTQPSLKWGHRPHPLIGLSCLLFVCPVPYLWECFPATAFLFGMTAMASFLSDHVYTGLDSYFHAVDRALAPFTFLFALVAVYRTSGLIWALSSFTALACHVMANHDQRKGRYNRFVFWHSMWHIVGVGLTVTCFHVNGATEFCHVQSE